MAMSQQHSKVYYRYTGLFVMILLTATATMKLNFSDIVLPQHFLHGGLCILTGLT